MGKKTAQAIFQTFGTEAKTITLNSPERLQEVPGIGLVKAISIKQKAQELQGSLTQQAPELNEYVENGTLDAWSLKRIRDTVPQLQEVLQINPYQLCSVDKIKFREIDPIARNLGLSATDERRERAALLTVIRLIKDEGHTSHPTDNILTWAGQLLNQYDDGEEHRPSLERLSKQMISEGLIREDGGHFYDPETWRQEGYIASRLANLKPPSNLRYAQAFKMVQQTGVRLDHNQQEAAATALTSPFSIIHGYAGTGKTSTVEAICRVAERMGWPVTLCAPSGKASRVLNERTGFPAFTTHRILGATPTEDDKIIFQVNSDNPLPPGVIVVDEGPMVGLDLFYRLISAIPKADTPQEGKEICGTVLVLVGDRGQLPPVDAGNPFIDIMDTGFYPTTNLTEIYRTGKGSSIARTLGLVRQGIIPTWPNDGEMDFHTGIGYEELPYRLTQELVKIVRDGAIPLSEAQIIVPNKIGTAGAPIISWRFQQIMGYSGANVVIGEREVPNQLRNEVPPETRVFQGDRVRHTKNNRDLNIFNGEIGDVIEVSPITETVIVQYPDRSDPVIYNRKDKFQLDLATAATVHTFQGSQVQNVLVGIHPSRLLDRRFAYTALSRATTYCGTIGSQRAMAEAILKAKSSDRCTRLGERIKELAQ